MVWLEEPRRLGGCLRTAAPFKRSGLRVQVAGGLLAALVSRIDEQAEVAKGGVDEPLWKTAGRVPDGATVRQDSHDSVVLDVDGMPGSW